MTTESHFEYAELVGRASRLLPSVHAALVAAPDQAVAILAEDVPTNPLDGQAGPLRVAFVGQYDAGKSTMVRALTGDDTVVIGADITTDKVRGFEWQGVIIQDTPGIHAGRTDHDDLTYAAIDSAHLLVFVVTNELFDGLIARHFRDLAFGRSKAREMILVVNKMGQDPGDASVKRPGVASVVKPLTPEELRTTFIDAESELDSRDADDEIDALELRKLGNFEDFLRALNAFVRENGHLARMALPIHRAHGTLIQAIRLGCVDDGPERGALELLHRKRNLFTESRHRLRHRLMGLIETAVADISGFGDEVAEQIEPGSTEASVTAAHMAAQRQAEQRCTLLLQEMTKATGEELDSLRNALDVLATGVLAKQLRGEAERQVPAAQQDVGLGVEPDLVIREAGDGWARAKKAGDTAKRIGDFVVSKALGPGSEAAKVGSAMATRGSDLHKLVYTVGKWAGVKFKPWGAVNVARHIGNAGRVLGAVGGVLAVVAQIQEDRQQEQHRIELRDARNEIRSNYRDAAGAVAAEVRERVDVLLTGFYDAEIAAVDAEAQELVGARQARANVSEQLQALERECRSLLSAIQTGPGLVLSPGGLSA